MGLSYMMPVYDICSLSTVLTGPLQCGSATVVAVYSQWRFLARQPVLPVIFAAVGYELFGCSGVALKLVLTPLKVSLAVVAGMCQWLLSMALECLQ